MAGSKVFDIKVNDKKIKNFFKDLDKNTKSIEKRNKIYWRTLTIFGHRDVMDHFEKQRGPIRKWESWSKRYAEFMKNIGKSGNKILQDTGTLRGGVVPTFRSQDRKKGIVLFNQVPYARRHDVGKSTKRGKPRPFMWWSDKAMKKVEKFTASFMLLGRKARK